jgi:ABC-type nitrate/sulfonate/bicarbonate transport system substrate-binding protein
MAGLLVPLSLAGAAIGFGSSTAAVSETTVPASEGSAPAEPMTVRIAYTAGTFPSIVNGKVGPLEFGPQYGLDITEDDILTFDSHATATQAVLAGEADVVAGSFTSTLLLNEQGQDFRVFAPFSNGNDLLFIGTGDVDEAADVTNPDVRVGIDSVGGLVNFVTNALLNAKGVDVNVEDLNTQIIEDSPLRTAALVNGDIDAALVHQYDMPGIIEQLGEENVHVLATLWEDVDGIVFETFAAPASWLEEHPAEAEALTKAILAGNRALASDFDTYVAAVDNYVEGGASDMDTLRTIWDLARQYEFWSYNGDLEQESLDFTVDVAQQSGIIEGDIDVSGIVDRRFMDAAVAELGEVTVEDILAAGDGGAAVTSPPTTM